LSLVHWFGINRDGGHHWLYYTHYATLDQTHLYTTRCVFDASLLEAIGCKQPIGYRTPDVASSALSVSHHNASLQSRLLCVHRLIPQASVYVSSSTVYMMC